MTYIWNILKVIENDYEDLTKKLWIQAFSESIFKPIEEIEQNATLKLKED